jgi:hypothetical protein
MATLLGAAKPVAGAVKDMAGAAQAAPDLMAAMGQAVSQVLPGLAPGQAQSPGQAASPGGPPVGGTP